MLKEGLAVSQVSSHQNSRPLTWPEQADIICLFACTEGHVSHRGWLGMALYLQIKKWLDDWERTKDTEHVKDMEFHHLLIRVNADIGMFQLNFSCFFTVISD